MKFTGFSKVGPCNSRRGPRFHPGPHPGRCPSRFAASHRALPHQTSKAYQERRRGAASERPRPPRQALRINGASFSPIAGPRAKNMRSQDHRSRPCAPSTLSPFVLSAKRSKDVHHQDSNRFCGDPAGGPAASRAGSALVPCDASAGGTRTPRPASLPVSIISYETGVR